MCTTNKPIVIDTRLMLVLAILAVSLFASSLYKRVITLDDAFFAEQAYWINQVGYTRTELFNGVLDWGYRQYVYHKLHVWQTSIVAKYIGWSPYYFKAVPLIYILLFMVSVHYYIRKYSPRNDVMKIFGVFVALMVINIHFVKFGFEARPEIMLMCVGFLSFLATRLGVSGSKPLYIAFSGIFAGMAVLLHLNGLIFIAAGAALLFYNKRFGYIFIFGLAAIAVSALYWLEMALNGALQTGLFQLINDPALSKVQTSWQGYLLKVLYAPKRYVSHIFDFSYVLLFVLMAYAGRKYIKENQEIRYLLIYFVAAEIALILISPGSKTMYMVLHMPFIILIIAILQNYIYLLPTRNALSLVIAFYVLTHMVSTFFLMEKSNSEIIQQHADIFNKYKIRSVDTVIAPSVFIFNEIENARIRAIEIIPLLEKSGCDMPCVFGYAYANNFNYLILKPDSGTSRVVTKMQVGDTYSCYQLLGIEYGYYIYGYGNT